MIAVALGIGYQVYAVDTSKPMMDSAVDKGVITEDQADNLKTHNQEYRQQKRGEMMEERLKNAVSVGTITEDEANQIRNWHKNRPVALDKLMKNGKKGVHMRGGAWE